MHTFDSKLYVYISPKFKNICTHMKLEGLVILKYKWQS